MFCLHLEEIIKFNIHNMKSLTKGYTKLIGYY